jgi:cytochrome b
MGERPKDSPLQRRRNKDKVFAVKVWDIPTRLFHWVLVVLVIISITTAKSGPTAMDYHEWCGVTILILVLFRIAWGFIGGQASRFKAFVRGPLAVRHHVGSLFRRDSAPHLGHNPLGGWSVILLLAALLIQAGSGLFANDDILTEGPLYDWVSKETSDWLTGIHHINKYILFALIAIHVGAIVFYLVYKKDNLIDPMISGVKKWHEPHPLDRTNIGLAVAAIGFIALAVYGLIYL